MKISKNILTLSKANWNLAQFPNKFLFGIAFLIPFIFSNCSDDDIQPVPDVPVLSSTTISSIESKRATLNATVIDDGNSVIIEQGFVLSKEHEPTINDQISVVIWNTSDFFTYVTDLEANTEYFVRAFATNSVGTSYGDEISFTTEHYIYEGDITFLTQDEVDSFGEKGYTIINGSLIIGPSDNITALDQLTGLTSVKGKLEIWGVYNLQTLKGLEDVTRVEYFYIYNTGLNDLNGLSGLTTVHGFTYSSTIIENNNLTNVDGLANLTDIKGLTIWLNNSLLDLDGLINLSTSLIKLDIFFNPSLTNIDGLINITSLEYLTIQNNQKLTNLDGLSNLTTVSKDFNFKDCPLVTNLNGLSNLETARRIALVNNTSLLSLDGLQNLKSIGFDCQISGNPLLNNYCALSSVLFSDNSFNFFAENNAYNPTKSDIANGNCSN